jgi:hypothetical protein
MTRYICLQMLAQASSRHSRKLRHDQPFFWHRMTSIASASIQTQFAKHCVEMRVMVC